MSREEVVAATDDYHQIVSSAAIQSPLQTRSGWHLPFPEPLSTRQTQGPTHTDTSWSAIGAIWHNKDRALA